MLWALIKVSREVLSTWGDLADEEKERVRAEADHVRRLVGELASLHGPLATRIAAELAEHGFELPDEHESAVLELNGGQACQAAVSSQGSRDVKLVSTEISQAVTALGTAMGPKAYEAARRHSPRSLRIAAKVGLFGARRAQKRWID